MHTLVELYDCIKLDKCTALWGEPCIVLEALHVQFLWQQSAASDCNQERQHTLANRCSLSSAVSFALCSRSRSLLLQCLSCPNASAQVLGVLSKMHTTARADRKELSAKKLICTSRLATTVWRLRFFYCQMLYCDKSCVPVTTTHMQEHFTLHCCFSDTLCARQPSQPVQTC